MNKEKYDKLEIKFDNENEELKSRLSYSIDIESAESMEYYQQETKHLNKYASFKQLLKASSLCGKNKQTYCAFKLKEFIVAKIMSLFNQSKDAISKKLADQKDKKKAALALNPKKIKKMFENSPTQFMLEQALRDASGQLKTSILEIKQAH